MMEEFRDYDYYMDDPTPRLDHDYGNEESHSGLDQGRLVGYILMLVVFFGVVFSYITTCLSAPTLRTDPGRWPQLLTAFAMVGTVLLDLLQTSTSFVTLPGICHVVLPFGFTVALLVNVGILLTIIERIVAVCRRDPETPGFSSRLAVSLIAGLALASLVFVVGVLYGFGGVAVYAYDGVALCTASPGIYHAWRLVDVILLILIAVLNIPLIVLLCCARVGNSKPYPLGKVIPVIVGSLIAVVSFMLDTVIAGMMVWRSWLLGFCLLLLVWLLGERDVRRPYLDLFCPCCPKKAPDEERSTLLDDRVR